MSNDFASTVEKIIQADPRYKEGAYEFVMEALYFAQKKFKRSKHVSSQNMLEAMRELLLKKYGPMTMSVLDFWGIKSTEDFGHLIFNLVENKILSKTEDDSIEQFQDGYDFTEAFDLNYRKQLNRKISRMR